MPYSFTIPDFTIRPEDVAIYQQDAQGILRRQTREWFKGTTATRRVCNRLAQSRFGGAIEHVNPLRQKSYDIVVGDKQKWLVMNRTVPSLTSDEVAAMAKQVYEEFAPTIVQLDIIQHYRPSLQRKLIVAHAHSLIGGTTYSDFALKYPNLNDHVGEAIRKKFAGDLGLFFAKAWNWPIAVTQGWKSLQEMKYTFELDLLKLFLPSRFRPTILACIQNMKAIMALPMTFNHCDLRMKDIRINPDDGSLNGVINWAMAEVAPFGTNLWTIEKYMGDHTYPESTFVRYSNYEEMKETFWGQFSTTLTKPLDESTRFAVHQARNMGLLLHFGFREPSRAENKHGMPIPMTNDQRHYEFHMLMLDTFLREDGTYFDDLVGDARPDDNGEGSEFAFFEDYRWGQLDANDTEVEDADHAKSHKKDGGDALDRPADDGHRGLSGEPQRRG